jgi:ATP-binding cassette, subfamily B, bacterial
MISRRSRLRLGDSVPTPPKRFRSSPLAVVRRATGAWRRLSPFLGTSRLKIVALALVSVTAGLAEAALLALLASIAAALSAGHSTVEAHLGPIDLNAEMSTLFVVGFALALGRGALQVLLAYLPANMSATAMANMRRRLFDAFTDASWSVQSSERDGHLQSMMVTHVNSTCHAIIAISSGLTAALMFSTLLVSAITLSVTTAIIVLVTSMALFFALRPFSRRMRRYAKALSGQNVEYSKQAQEIVLMAEETQVFGASDSYRQSFYRGIEQVRSPLFHTRFLSKAVPALYQSLALLLLLVAVLVISIIGSSGIAALGAVVLILIRSLTYGQQIQTAVTNMDELIPFMHRLGDAIDHYLANPRQDGDKPLPVIERLGLENIHFSYIPGKPVLRGVDFSVRMGEAIGIVGPSGAGKSSIVQLLLRLREPTAGMLQVNGEDARSFRRSDWQRRVAYVPQTPQLIWGTVADNIRFYRPHLSDADIESAARRAHIHEDVMSWPQGYQTVIGQRASAVSGGQRQRLCLARALAESPDVLVLDEPTSALDVKSEMLIQQSLEQLKGEVILFLVAHRLSTLAICDRVMVIVGGRLQAIDEPAHLMATNDFYREVSEITREQSRM